jgi:hypothetical protein
MRKMKFNQKWVIVPTLLTLVTAFPNAAYANPVQTPLSAPVVVQGSSSGPQSGQCSVASDTPTQVIRVTEAFTSLRFSIQGSGQPTLLITGPGGHNQCVQADSLSGGTIQVPGVWEQGTYSLFVGDRTQGSHPFTLSITQEN